MAKTVRSARGQLVNFDVLEIKQQMASAPKPVEVAVREDFIDQKFNRRLKKLKKNITNQVIADTTPDAEEN